MTRAQIEYMVAGIITMILVALLLNSVIHARAAVRDDLRKTDLSDLKRGSEMYFNQHMFYPAPLDHTLGCTSSDDPHSWFFGHKSPLLIEQRLNAIPHDVRETQGYTYRYCITDIQNETAAGYYFEAQLEVNQPDIVAVDEDETRNFTYRVLHEERKILYRVCGGTEKQCELS